MRKRVNILRAHVKFGNCATLQWIRTLSWRLSETVVCHRSGIARTKLRNARNRYVVEFVYKVQ